jgi:cytochrome c-type biogenesis protein CcmE
VSPERRRNTRLISALFAALVLAGALVYTSFSEAAQVRDPSQLANAMPGQAYQVTGIVLPGYLRRGTELVFRLADRAGTGRTRRAVLISYTGAVPDPFRAGREVIVTVVKSGRSFVGQPNSLITKCPSKFAAAPPRPRSASSGS